jgi:hypothetical protein
MMEHPYKKMEERTPREYIVGYLCKSIEENS